MNKYDDVVDDVHSTRKDCSDKKNLHKYYMKFELI